MKSIKRNWEDLPTELLHLIVRELPDYCDVIRLRAVCKSWHASLSVHYLPPSFPWILELGSRNKTRLKFYSIVSNKVYTFRVPASSNKEHVGLATMHIRQFATGVQFSLLRYRQSCRFPERYLSMLNPLTRNEFCVPFLNDSESSEHLQSEYYVLFTSDGVKRLSSKPADGNCDFIGGDLVYMYAYSKGLLFMIKCRNLQDNVTKVLDIGSRKELYAIPSPEGESNTMAGPYLVESSGEILRVRYTVSYKRANYKFYIHRLEFAKENRQPCWVKVTSIGDQMLFFDFIAGRAFSLRASGVPGLHGDCIYFIELLSREKGLSQVYMINKFCISTGKTVFIRCPFSGDKSITWFLPTLNPYLTSMNH